MNFIDFTLLGDDEHNCYRNSALSIRDKFFFFFFDYSIRDKHIKLKTVQLSQFMRVLYIVVDIPKFCPYITRGMQPMLLGRRWL